MPRIGQIDIPQAFVAEPGPTVCSIARALPKWLAAKRRGEANPARALLFG